MSATYTHCTSCGAKPGGLTGRYGDGLCGVCHDDRIYAASKPELAAELAKKEADKAAASAMLVTTEAAPAGLRVSARLGIVSADVAFGAGPLKDIAVALRDGWGGRSETMSNLMGDSRNTALQELTLEAAKIGANAVIGVGFTITNIGTNGSMTLVSATGTAALVEG